MKKKIYLFIILALLALTAIPLSMVPANVMNYLTDILTSKNGGVDVDTEAVMPYIFLFFFSTIGVSCINIYRKILSGIYLENAVEERKISMFKKLLRTTPDFFHGNEPAKISNTIVKESRSIEVFHLNYWMGMPVTLIGLGTCIYILFFGLDKDTYFVGDYLPQEFSQVGNWFLATLIILLAPLHAFFLLFDKKLQSTLAASGQALDDLINRSVENLTNIREIRNHFAFDYIIERMKNGLYRIKKIETSIVKINAMFDGMPDVINGLTKAILLSIGAYLCVSEIQIPGLDLLVEKIEWKDYMGFTGIAVVVYGYIGELSQYVLNWRMNRESIKRVLELENLPQVFSEASLSQEKSDLAKGVIYDKVNFTAQDGHKVLNNINIEINPGDKVAFVGPSGAGKSTTINLLTREISPFPGQIDFRDKNISDTNFLDLSREIAMVQQRSSVLDMSIRDNILLGLRRPSTKTIDDHGPVDVSHLENCNSIHNLNMILVKTVESVDLSRDMINCALERSLDERSFNDIQTMTSLNKLREACLEAAKHEDQYLLEHFDENSIINDATVVDNLLFGVYQEETVIEGRLPKKKLQILKAISGEAIFEELVNIGYQLFQADQQIALNLQIQSKKLHDTLSSYRNITSNSLNLNKDLKALFGIHRNMLADIALDTPVIKAKPYMAKTFLEQLLNCRKKLLKSELKKTLEVTSFDSNKITRFIPLKEYLINGKINGSRTDARKKITSLIEQAYMRLKFEKLLILLGLESPAGYGGHNLSEGMAMKVVIARILLKQSNFLLLDEATAALDESSQANIVELIEQDYKNKTIVTITHRLSTIKNFDKIYVFDQGEIVQQGSYAELTSQEGLFSELLKQERSGHLDLSKTSLPITQSISTIISQSALFKGLQRSEIMLLERVSEIQTCPKDEILFEQGDKGTEYYFIVNGTATFFSRENGKVHIIDEYGPGQSFGELALFGKGKRVLGVKAATDLTLCVITKKDLEKILEACPNIAIKLLSQISNFVSELRDQVRGDS
ncbi:MAG: ATP-binding cassette domain-containing protein [Lentisphaerales bacterium]|nr:ATP-binding cassette domain-containing protein [Lentisphaerales bacterium]